jgi:hypothetical protein
MTDGREVVAVRVQREQQWAFERRLEHLSYRQIRIAANRPTDEGGLGHDLSESALRGLVQGYAERMRQSAEVDLVMLRDRQAAEVDDMARRAKADMVAAGERLATLDRAIAGFEVNDRADAKALARLVELRRGLGAEIESAERRLTMAHNREAALFGIDAGRMAPR